jgi:hypothetical protein
MSRACSAYEERRNAYINLLGKPEGKRPLGRPRRMWEDNFKMDLGERVWGGRGWIDLAYDRDLVNTLINLGVPQNLGKFLSG